MNCPIGRSSPSSRIRPTATPGRCRMRTPCWRARRCAMRSEEHTSELQSLMRISYAVFCLKKKKNRHQQHNLRNSAIDMLCITKMQDYTVTEATYKQSILEHELLRRAPDSH